MTVSVTVGIPVFNASAFVTEAVVSVLAQTFEDWELLLVDDGSSDESPEICRQFEGGRVRYIAGGKNRGLVHRLNEMVALARTPLFARMDADDIMHPERLARQVNLFRLAPDLQVCGTAAYVIDEHGQPYGVRCDGAEVQFQGIRSGFIHPTVMARTEWLRANPYDPAFVRAEDTELWQRVDANTRCRLIPEPLLFYREPLSISLAKYRASCATNRRIIRAYGPARVGAVRTAAALLLSHAKEAAYVAASATGLDAALVRRRSRCCTPHERREALAVLSRLRHAAAPSGCQEQMQ